MVVIPGGRFLMGSPTGEQGRSDNERQHEVGITPFAVGKYPVTLEDL
ncbi:MAG: SUMF1/EgtB/PvdO family nonheme iron enzyme [Chromatiales bacterium]|nr:SUMF1/EgtB/PvdO family nonheme iron enzyme [Chromatiales bacterium]